MSDAPERIWIAPWREGDWSEGDWDDNEGKTLNDKPCIEYVRADRIEALTAKLAQAVERLEAWVKLAEHCSIEDGVCCCGEDMEGHSNPMNCGHSPVDHGAYIAGQLEESTRATLAEIKAT